jgi:hypothetical protein
MDRKGDRGVGDTPGKTPAFQPRIKAKPTASPYLVLQLNYWNPDRYRYSLGLRIHTHHLHHFSRSSLRDDLTLTG